MNDKKIITAIRGRDEEMLAFVVQKYAKLSSWLSMITRSKAIDRYRQIIKRRESSMEEIAAALDMPKKQVENRLYYVRQKLKKRMGK